VHQQIILKKPNKHQIINNIVQPQQLKILNKQQTQHSITNQQKTNLNTNLLINTINNKLTKIIALKQEHTQRTILNTKKLTHHLNNNNQHHKQIKINNHNNHNIEQHNKTTLNILRETYTITQLEQKIIKIKHRQHQPKTTLNTTP